MGRCLLSMVLALYMFGCTESNDGEASTAGPCMSLDWIQAWQAIASDSRWMMSNPKMNIGMYDKGGLCVVMFRAPGTPLSATVAFLGMSNDAIPVEAAATCESLPGGGASVCTCNLPHCMSDPNGVNVVASVGDAVVHSSTYSATPISNAITPPDWIVTGLPSCGTGAGKEAGPHLWALATYGSRTHTHLNPTVAGRSPVDVLSVFYPNTLTSTGWWIARRKSNGTLLCASSFACEFIGSTKDPQDVILTWLGTNGEQLTPRCPAPIGYDVLGICPTVLSSVGGVGADSDIVQPEE